METLVKVKERPILFNGEMVRAILEGRKTQTRRVVKPQLGTDPYDKFIHVESIDPGEWYYWWDVMKYNVSGGQIYRDTDQEYQEIKNPYGKPGEQLWVRETFADVNTGNGPAIIWRADGCIHYCVDDAYPVEYERYPKMDFCMWVNDLLNDEPEHRWRPSIHMPRWASRIQLEIVDVRVEQVQDISERDMVAEGIALKDSDYEWNRRDRYSQEQFFGLNLAQHWIDLWNSINEKRGYGWDVNPWVWVVEFRMIENV